MEINLNEKTKGLLTLFLLIILPMLIILLIVATNPIQAYYVYIGLITWIGMGIMLYSALR